MESWKVDELGHDHGLESAEHAPDSIELYISIAVIYFIF